MEPDVDEAKGSGRRVEVAVTVGALCVTALPPKRKECACVCVLPV